MRGHWTREAFLGLKGFTSNLENQHIRLLIDNAAAIAFIKKKGGTHSKIPSYLSLSIWSWCLERNLSIYAEHIPGVQNCLADSLSRRDLESSDWMLNGQIFKTLSERWGPFDVDLFAILS